jgi:hypothetical protein
MLDWDRSPNISAPCISSLLWLSVSWQHPSKRQAHRCSKSTSASQFAQVCQALTSLPAPCRRLAAPRRGVQHHRHVRRRRRVHVRPLLHARRALARAARRARDRRRAGVALPGGHDRADRARRDARGRRVREPCVCRCALAYRRVPARTSSFEQHFAQPCWLLMSAPSLPLPGCARACNTRKRKVRCLPCSRARQGRRVRRRHLHVWRSARRGRRGDGADVRRGLPLHSAAVPLPGLARRRRPHQGVPLCIPQTSFALCFA